MHPSSGGARGIPENVEQVEVVAENETIFVSLMLVRAGLVKSNGEARRLIAQGGVQIDGERVTDGSATLVRGKEHLVKVGKRHFRNVVLK